MMESALGDCKPHSGTKKSLEPISQVSSEASTLEMSNLTKDKVPKMNQVRKPGECHLMIRRSTENAKGNHANTNKCIVTMISSEMALPQLRT